MTRQMEKPTNKKLGREKGCIAALCLSVLAVMLISHTFTGRWPWMGHSYNSYMLQARAWLGGSLDLGKDYPHLELAIFNGKYFVSFPPFPSYLMLPFALVGWYNGDGFIALVCGLMAAVYAYKILEHYGIKNERAIFFALFLTIGSNWLFTSQVAWVWFIAQNLAFTLSLMAIYYALKAKPGLSLALWACAVGCRPLTALQIPVLLYLMYKAEDPKLTALDMIKKHFFELIPMAVIALSYMILNFARFGNPLEFGHNYLPEFTRTATGQFNITYLKDNIVKLIRLPEISFKNKWEYQSTEGMCMFLISPIFVSYIVYTLRAIVRKTISVPLSALIFAVMAAELIFIALHKTMGGSQFGNRYTNDVLPLAFLGLASSLGERGSGEKINYILFFWGLSINLIGSVLFYM